MRSNDAELWRGAMTRSTDESNNEEQMMSNDEEQWCVAMMRSCDSGEEADEEH